MNRRSLPELLADLDDLTLRSRDAGVTPDILTHLARARDALYLLSQLPERDSVPPLFESNQPARRTANEHFRNASKLMKGILK